MRFAPLVSSLVYSAEDTLPLRGGWVLRAASGLDHVNAETGQGGV